MSSTHASDLHHEAPSVPYPLAEGEEIKICPYNRGHKILASKYANHIVKCQRQHTDSGLEVCCFNSTHPASELKSHEETCENRPTEKVIPGGDTSLKKSSLDTGHPNVNVTEEIGESWDDAEEGSYDPSIKLHTMPVLTSSMSNMGHPVAESGAHSDDSRDTLDSHQLPREWWDDLQEETYYPKLKIHGLALASSVYVEGDLPPSPSSGVQ